LGRKLTTRRGQTRVPGDAASFTTLAGVVAPGEVGA
jgi:hypothetical protein